jgi:small subunit ribosomal protein S19e
VTTQYDVPGEHLVGALANTLKSDDAISPPDWSNGINGPIGTERLSKHYSGPRDRGSKPNRSLGGGRKILRSIMQQLETAGFIVKSKQGGRGLTPKGQSILDNTAFAVKKNLQKEMSSLSKY